MFLKNTKKKGKKGEKRKKKKKINYILFKIYLFYYICYNYNLEDNKISGDKYYQKQKKFHLVIKLFNKIY